MDGDLNITSIAHVIQLAVAPVFLLTGIAGLLSVLTRRVGRIVDRKRHLESIAIDSDELTEADRRSEMRRLWRRARMANWAMSLCTFCALLICMVIVVLFVGAFQRVDVSRTIAVLFITAMTVLIGGLICFIREIHIAISGQRIKQPNT